MENFPDATSKLAGAKIQIEKTKEASWLKVGATVRVEKAAYGKLLIGGSWWVCRNNSQNHFFKMVAPPAKKRVFDVNVVTSVVNLTGTYVVLGPDFKEDDNQEDVFCGKVTQVGGSVAEVRWYDKYGRSLHRRVYNVGNSGLYELAFDSRSVDDILNEMSANQRERDRQVFADTSIPAPRLASDPAEVPGPTTITINITEEMIRQYMGNTRTPATPPVRFSDNMSYDEQGNPMW